MSEHVHQAIAHTTRKGWEVMLEQALPIGAKSIYGVPAGRLSLTVFAAAASLRGTSLFVYTHPPCSNLVYSVRGFIFGPFKRKQRVCNLTPWAVDLVDACPKSIQTACLQQAHLHPAARLLTTGYSHIAVPGRHKSQMHSPGGKLHETCHRFPSIGLS